VVSLPDWIDDWPGPRTMRWSLECHLVPGGNRDAVDRLDGAPAVTPGVLREAVPGTAPAACPRE